MALPTNSKKYISGITLIEMLIGVVISTIIMGAMYTTYTVVNQSYSQVTNKAKISRSGRDIVGTMLREIRMAGFKYMGDLIPITNEHNPIKIYKETSGTSGCDVIEIVYEIKFKVLINYLITLYLCLYI